MYILAIESSCDETSCAIIKDGDEVLSNVVSSQIDTHKIYGGVFPEVASRLHLENINFVIKEAIEKADINYNDLDAIAVTYGPGLVGSLHVGLMAAKTLSWALNIPLIPVNHMAGHIYANKLSGVLEFPLLALIVSGGHTELVYMKEDYNFEIIGQTLDDAVGEAYDKVSRVLGLGYPGGPIIDKLSKEGTDSYTLPKIKTENPLDFSYSGLKSSVFQLMEREKRNDRPLRVEDVCATFQNRAIGEIMNRVNLALEEYDVKMLVMGGGVAANSLLRKNITELKQVPVLIPPLWACMDQAAMIGLAAYPLYLKSHFADSNLSPKSNLKFNG